MIKSEHFYFVDGLKLLPGAVYAFCLASSICASIYIYLLTWVDRLSSLHESWFSLGVSRVWGSQLQFSSEWYKLNSKESKPIDTLHAYLSPKLFHGYIVHSAYNQSQLNAMILCTNSLQRWYPINLNIRATLLPSSTTVVSRYCSKFVQTLVA